jgi:cyclic beta-1,2-glucan synthetase
MFVQTEYLPEFGALVATRRPRAGRSRRSGPHISPSWKVISPPIRQYESDRAEIPRTRQPRWVAPQPLSGTSCCRTRSEPFSTRFSRFAIALSSRPARFARIAFWTLVASSREELIWCCSTSITDRSAFDRAKTLAWTQAQVQLRHLDVEPEEAADFQRLWRRRSCMPTRASGRRPRRFCAAPAASPRSGRYRISGDLPIVLLRIGYARTFPRYASCCAPTNTGA